MSEEDELLGALARRQRTGSLDGDSVAYDEEAWERFTHGDLDEAEVAALVDGLPPEEEAELRTLYAPIDDDVRARIAGDFPRPARKPRRWLRSAVAASSLAAAAAVLFVVWPSPEALPRYGVELSEGAATKRGDTALDGRYRADDRLEIVLRPNTHVEGEVAVAAFDGDRQWSPPVEVAESGSARIAGRAGELLERPGTHELVLVVGRPGSLPRTVDEVDFDHAHRLTIELLADVP